MGRVHYAITLALMLAAMWLALSGRTDNTLLLFLGATSVILVILLVERMRTLDEETSPFHRAFAAIGYWIWLGGEIVRANIMVSRAILRADLDITPRLFRVRASQATDLGRATFANSITLTPGTVTIDVDGDDLIVHALLDSMSDPAGFEEMDRRARQAIEGGER